MRIVGVIAAAGYATRLQPLNCSKEVIEVGGRPVMDYVVERMNIAGCDELRVVTRPEKKDVVAHARTLGATVVLGHPETPSESFAAGIDGLDHEDIVLIGWPDTLWEPENGYVPLVDAIHGGADIALGLFEAPPADLRRSDVIAFDAFGGVAGIHVKPTHPPSGSIWGCAVARARALHGLEGEEWPGSFFELRRRQGLQLRGIRLSDRWLDVGTKEALQRVDEICPG
jgi:glucose-1-phosphate thymidylyltransferase